MSKLNNNIINKLILLVKEGKTNIEMQKAGKIKNQNEARAMFRVVLGLMGLDYSEYIDEQYLKNNK